MSVQDSLEELLALCLKTTVILFPIWYASCSINPTLFFYTHPSFTLGLLLLFVAALIYLPLHTWKRRKARTPAEEMLKALGYPLEEKDEK